MEIIMFFGIVCLILMVISGIIKQTQARNLANAIIAIAKVIEQDSTLTTCALARRFQRELNIIATSIGRIESEAICRFPIIREFVCFLPSECYKLDMKSRRKCIASTMIKHFQLKDLE